MNSRQLCPLLVLVIATGCGEGGRVIDQPDVPLDGGLAASDAGKNDDAGQGADAGAPDDGGPSDSGADAGPTDAGRSDAGAPDAGMDAGPADAGPPPMLNWPFQTGNCFPARPADLTGPGTVDPENLCTRNDNLSGHVNLNYGDYGYGSIGLVTTAEPWPDTDFFDVPDARGGDILRVTVEATSGSDFEPSVSATINGASIIHYMDPVASNRHRVTREIFIAPFAVSLDLMISDARAVSMATYGSGARSTYSVHIEKVEKTPIPLTLPASLSTDFTASSVVGLYDIELPDAEGAVLINALATNRLHGALASDVKTLVWLYDPNSRFEIENAAYHSSLNSSITYEYSPSTFTPAGHYWVVVDSESSAIRTGYDLTVAFEGPPPNDVCAGAVDATPSTNISVNLQGDTRRAQSTFELSSDFASWTCAPAAEAASAMDGRDVVYFATVPAGKTLTATVTPTGSWNPALWLSTDCTDGSELSCVALMDTHGTSAAETATWTNNGTGPRTIFIHIDSSSTSGVFTLATSLADSPAVPTNDLCANATSIANTAGTHTVTGTTASATNNGTASGTDVAAVCKDTGGSWMGSDVVYSIAVPAGKRVKVRGTAGPPDWNMALWISSDCAGAASCLSAQDDSVSPETVSWWNQSANEQTVYIHVDSQEETGGAFSLSVTVDAPFGKDVCPGVAQTLTNNYVATTTNETNDYSFSRSNVSLSCASAFSGTTAWLGRDHVYSYSVPAGVTLSLDVKSTVMFQGQPVDTWMAMLTTSCDDMISAGHACVSAGASHVAWTNTTGATTTVYLIVDQVSADLPNASYNVLPR